MATELLLQALQGFRCAESLANNAGSIWEGVAAVTALARSSCASHARCLNLWVVEGRACSLPHSLPPPCDQALGHCEAAGVCNGVEAMLAGNLL